MTRLASYVGQGSVLNRGINPGMFPSSRLSFYFKSPAWLVVFDWCQSISGSPLVSGTTVIPRSWRCRSEDLTSVFSPRLGYPKEKKPIVEESVNQNTHWPHRTQQLKGLLVCSINPS